MLWRPPALPLLPGLGPELSDDWLVLSPTSSQGLTLVHISAERKRFLWDGGCIETVFRRSQGLIVDV